MLIYDNEYETKENNNWNKDKIELQHIAFIYICILTCIYVRSNFWTFKLYFVGRLH